MRRNGRLIIAEDEQIIALGLRLVLNQAGHEVCGICTTGPGAVALAEQHRPDLALLDVRLAEDTDGVTAAREMRRLFGTPAVLVTGHLDTIQARQSGALGLLRKPFDPQRLVAVVEAALAWLATGRRPARPVSGLLLPDSAGQSWRVG